MGNRIEELRVKVEENGNDVDLLNDFGIALAEEGCYEEAAKQFEKAVELTPERADSHYNLGVLFGKFLLDDIAANEMWEDHTDEEVYFGKASTCYKAAFRLDPKMTAALNNLARLCDAMGMHDEARAYFEQSLQVDKNQPEVEEDLDDLLSRDDVKAADVNAVVDDEIEGVDEEGENEE